MFFAVKYELGPLGTLLMTFVYYQIGSFVTYEHYNVQPVIYYHITLFCRNYNAMYFKVFYMVLYIYIKLKLLYSEQLELDVN